MGFTLCNIPQKGGIFQTVKMYAYIKKRKQQLIYQDSEEAGYLLEHLNGNSELPANQGKEGNEILCNAFFIKGRKAYQFFRRGELYFLNNCEILPPQSLHGKRVNRISHGLANLFCKSSDIKYYGFCRPYGLCHNHSILLF